eukprot:scaffold140600_cov18-Tisochrysis_lutea.AAC.5
MKESLASTQQGLAVVFLGFLKASEICPCFKYLSKPAQNFLYIRSTEEREGEARALLFPDFPPSLDGFIRQQALNIAFMHWNAARSPHHSIVIGGLADAPRPPLDADLIPGLGQTRVWGRPYAFQC